MELKIAELKGCGIFYEPSIPIDSGTQTAMALCVHIFFIANQTDNTMLGTHEYMVSSSTPLTVERSSTDASTACTAMVQGMRTAGDTIHAREELMAQSSPDMVDTTAHAAIKTPSERRSLYCLPNIDKI